MRVLHVQQLEGAFPRQPIHSKLCRLLRFLSSCLTIRIECTHIQQQPYTSLVIHFYLHTSSTVTLPILCLLLGKHRMCHRPH